MTVISGRSDVSVSLDSTKSFAEKYRNTLYYTMKREETRYKHGKDSNT